jgi:hypothetical protein
VSVGADGSAQPDKNGNPTGVLGSSRTLGVTKSIGYGSDSAHDSGTTRSGINTSNITITDAAGQAATGKTVEQIIADIKTDTVTNTVALNSGSIENNFDKEAVQKELDLQVKVTQEFDKNRQAAKTEINKAIDKAKQDLANATTDADKKAAQDHIDDLKAKSLIFDGLTGALYGPNSNGVTGTIAQVVAPHVSNAIGDYFAKPENKDNEDGHILAHTILGAAVAAATGNNALVGGLSAGGAEAVAPILIHYLYGDIEPDNLTPEQKSTVSAIIGLGAGALGGTVDGSIGVVTGSIASQNAIDNNKLNEHQKAQFRKEFDQACTNGFDSPDCMKVLKKWMDVSMEDTDFASWIDKDKAYEGWRKRYMATLSLLDSACDGVSTSGGADAICKSAVAEKKVQLYVEHAGENSITGNLTIQPTWQSIYAKYHPDLGKNTYAAGKAIIDLAAIAVPQARTASMALDVGEIFYDVTQGEYKSAFAGTSAVAATEIVGALIAKNPTFRLIGESGRKKLAETIVESAKFSVNKGLGTVKDNYVK